jgi:hypothetical protein
MAGLPFLLKGDGTAVGEARVLVYYNIGIAGTLIGMLALMQACGAVSQEIAERQIQLIRAKPVSTMHIWLGKWLGILFINAVLIAVAGLTTVATLSVKGLAGGAIDDEVLVARRRLAPALERAEFEADHLFDELKRQGRIGPDADEAEVKQMLKVGVMAARTTVGPGEKRQWNIRVPKGCSPDPARGESAVELRSLFNNAMRDEKPMLCSWRVFSKDGKELFSVPARTYVEGINRIPLPPALVAGEGVLTVEFSNDETKDGRTVVFNETRGLEILVSEGGFGMNLVRAALIIFISSALLAALGLTLGAVFSFPVAVFAACALVAASFIAHFFMTTETVTHSHAEGSHAEHMRIDTTAGEKIAAGFEMVVGPVLERKPAEFLSEGLLVSWSEVGSMALRSLIIYTLCLFGAGACGLSRRQLALPDTV